MARLEISPRQELKPADLFQISLIIMLSNKRIKVFMLGIQKILI